MAYLTLAVLKNYLSVDAAEQSEDTTLQLSLDAAQAAIERWTSRKFETPFDTTHVVNIQDHLTFSDGPYAKLWLDAECCQLTQVLNGDSVTVIPLSAVVTFPRNLTPFQAIQLRNYYWGFGQWGDIQILGRWGYSITPPADIVQATKRLAAYFYKQKDSQVFDVTVDTATGQVTVPKGIPADVRAIVDSYRPLSG